MLRAFYRKYRPKTFDELLGQETNVLILKNAAKEGRLGHAYLFYGPRGTGKTTTARLVAKLANCEKRAADEKFRAKGEPCNACNSCRAIDEGRSFDVIEIDAASNRGIDEIRNLKEGIKAAPSIGPYTIYIIDEAHMLTKEASNALLKTLEEPPAHAMLILATTESEKLPVTIVSRTQRFLFKKLSKAAIVDKLKMIAKEEKINADDAALELIAAAAEGSFRDAESLLDQIAALEGTIDLASVEHVTGRMGQRKVAEFAALLIAGSSKESIANLETLSEEGHNLTQFTKDLIHYLRKILALKLSPSLEKLFESDLTRDELTAMKVLIPKASEEALVKLIKAFIRAYSEMRYSPFAIVPLEIAVAENAPLRK